MNATPGQPEHLAAGKPAAKGQFLLQRRRRLMQKLLPDAGGHLLDFGCGNGAQTLVLAPVFDRVTGVDVDPVFLDSFNERIASENLQDRVSTLIMENGRIPLSDSSVDLVSSFTVLEHVPDEQSALAEMYRVLRPGGRLLISVPNRWWIFETHGADLPLLPWNRVPLVSWWPKVLHDRWARARIYRQREIVQLVADAGFTVTSSLRVTAPMDMIRWAPLRQLIRRVFFGRDSAAVPFLATEILVSAER